MSHNLVFPLLRTPDLDAVFDLADRLLALGAVAESERIDGTELWARVPTRTALKRLLEAVPEARVHEGIRKAAETPEDAPVPPEDDYGAYLELPTPQHARAATHAALRVHDRLQVHWHDLCWPAVPALGLSWTRRHAHLQVNAHHEAEDLDHPWTPHHVLYLHAGDDIHAEWLAAQVGATLIGEPYIY
ncbi:hypothetical protein ACIQWA_05505 [Kitasatospora sp. NPDC098652]|uniref:hypothetical protein n=1 Tax=Kitasatospora sp. NPDC098652 TaxID=3364095 RepID=UPI0038128E73